MVRHNNAMKATYNVTTTIYKYHTYIVIKAFSDLEIFLVTASKSSRYSWKK